MAQFLKSLPYVLTNEGGYGEPPECDQPTNQGIIAATLAQYRGVDVSTITTDDIKNLEQDEINDIYLTLYWIKLNLDRVAIQNVATCLLDTGVNRGIGIAGIYAQKICNLNGANLKVDGVIGEMTVTAINGLGQTYFIKTFEAMEVAGYEAIIQAHPEDVKYRNAWEARAQKLLTLAPL